MKRTLFILGFVFIAAFSANAQYNAAVGLRGGLGSGITFKKMMGSSSALEFIGSTRYYGLNLTLLFEKQNTLAGVPGLYWFYGFGGHAGYWTRAKYNPWFDSDGDHLVVGVDGILGIEYVFAEFPVSLSIDWQPAYNLWGYSGFWADNGALSIRYTF